MREIKEITYNNRYTDPHKSKDTFKDGDYVILHSEPDHIGRILGTYGDSVKVKWTGVEKEELIKTIRLDKYRR